jgi:hypothetical protein
MRRRPRLFSVCVNAPGITMSRAWSISPNRLA